MFERYTEKARRVIFFARYEASKYGSQYIAPEHLLLGLIREARAVLTSVLPGRSLSALENELRAQQSASASKALPVSVDLPLDNPAKRVLAYAAEEAARRSDHHIGAEHLVLALLREPGGAAEVLKKHGVDLSIARERIRSELGHQARKSGSTEEVALPLEQATGTVGLEFVDADGMTTLALSMPDAVPRIGEEIIFENEDGSDSFRVVAVSHIFQPAASGRVSKELVRIRVQLEKIAETF